MRPLVTNKRPDLLFRGGYWVSRVPLELPAAAAAPLGFVANVVIGPTGIVPFPR